MFSFEQFEREFKPKLGSTIRWEGFSHIARNLCGKEIITIVETGTIRSEHDWSGNGQSTMLWNWMMVQSAGHTISVDINPSNIIKCRILCRNVDPVQSDSLLFFNTNKERGLFTDLDLLYLDSYDHDHPKKPQSELHASAELGSVYDYLPSGCLIAVDDCHADGTGKHYLIKHFFQRLGVEPLVSSYIHVWRKP